MTCYLFFMTYLKVLMQSILMQNWHLYLLTQGESSGPIMGLVDDGSLVSNIGVKYHYVYGVQTTEFVVIENLPFGQAAAEEEDN